MRRTLFFLACFFYSILSHAQEYSRYDVNHDGFISIEDVPFLINRILGNVNIYATNIEITKPILVLSVGEAHQLNANIIPSDTDIKDLTWKSADENVALVHDGIVQAIKSGTTTITVSTMDGSNLTNTCKLIVDDTGYLTNRQTVDLGLPSGTLWANMNLGASNIYDSGELYTWGWPNATYSSDLTCGSIYSDIIGTIYDTARYLWGDNWIMPSIDDLNELWNNCEHRWFENYNNSGISGVEFIGPNGNILFLPKTGIHEYWSEKPEDNYFGYWSGTWADGFGWGLIPCLWSGGPNLWGARTSALGIRPVYKENVETSYYKYICPNCGWIYDPEVGYEDIPSLTPFERIQQYFGSYSCQCGQTFDDFQKYNE